MALNQTDILLIILHIFFIGFFILWIWMLIDAIFANGRRLKCKILKDNPDGSKLVWILVIIFAGWVGAVVYYILEKRERRK
ncbi:hypothetical protein D4Q76_01015 [archaeon]|nr:MAG: hypothetical protein D4Q76_01015 [archaeon]